MKLAKTYTRWEVIGELFYYASEAGHWYPYVLCRCECGTEREVAIRGLRSGHSKSCGCLKKELIVQRFLTHGHTVKGRKPPEYGVWDAMKQRCYNPNDPRYEDYGGRGIKICRRWRTSFPKFIADMRPRPPGTSIDRYPDRDGDYKPSNCRWATPEEQNNNTRRNVRLTFKGNTRTVTEWSAVTGIVRNTLYDRLKRGWSIERTLTEPVRTRATNIRN